VKKDTEIQIMFWINLRVELTVVRGFGGIHRRRGEDNIKMDRQELGGGGVDLFGLPQDREN
jgi:hypothetical protein